MRTVEAREHLIEKEVILVTRYKGEIINQEQLISSIDGRPTTISKGSIDKSLLIINDTDDKAGHINSDFDVSTEFGSHLSIGALLLNSGKITGQDIEAIVRLQKQEGLYFGAAAKQLNLVSELDIQQALAKQFNYPYIAATDDIISHDVIAAYQPFSTQVGDLRTVRSQLKLHWFTNERKLLSITSPGRNEGKSYLCANLAVAFSQLGEKVLLIDANLHFPKQHELFKLQQRQGLSDLLAGRVDESIIFKSPQFRDLSILPAGTIAPNPAELISRKLKQSLQHFSEHYNIILVDTPASQTGTEAQMISVSCGGSLLVARKNHTRLKDLKEMQAEFNGSGIRCLGAVINEF